MCAQPRALPAPRASPMRGLRLKVRASLRERASNPFENRRDALSAADAHRDERIALVRALQLVERLDGENAAGRADRMAERHRAAVWVDLRLVEAEVFGHCHGLHGERLVRFDDVHIGGLESGLLQHPLYRWYRPET